LTFRLSFRNPFGWRRPSSPGRTHCYQKGQSERPAEFKDSVSRDPVLLKTVAPLNRIVVNCNARNTVDQDDVSTKCAEDYGLWWISSPLNRAHGGVRHSGITTRSTLLALRHEVAVLRHDVAVLRHRWEVVLSRPPTVPFWSHSVVSPALAGFLLGYTPWVRGSERVASVRTRNRPRKALNLHA
jgi:hypothetical protein